ncbi:MAG TPA: high-potential iron-sulfur protein [Myxococcota bacterium]|jgi:hypothetical protein|nr:high-potential iron-sulfur protein [Myxococcota bacterium]
MSRWNGTPDADRRRLLKMAAIGLATAPFTLSLASGIARAADAPMVDEADPIAASVGYHCEAGKNPKHVADQFCKGCQLFSGAPGAKMGPCALFGGKNVCADGWCQSWVKKAG